MGATSDIIDGDGMTFIRLRNSDGERWVVVRVDDLGEARKVVDFVERLREQLSGEIEWWRAESRATHSAFEALRNTLAEAGVPLPSAEAALLKGPEPGPEYETVALEVTALLSRLRAENAELRKLLLDEMVEACTECNETGPFKKSPDCDGCASFIEDRIRGALAQKEG